MSNIWEIIRSDGKSWFIDYGEPTAYDKAFNDAQLTFGDVVEVKPY